MRYPILDDFAVIQFLSDLYGFVGADKGVGLGFFASLIGVFIIPREVRENKSFVFRWNVVVFSVLFCSVLLGVMRFTGWIDIEDVLGEEYYYAGKIRATESGDKANGYGRQFDLDGNLIYKGNFRMNLYHGEGIYFWPEGDSDGRDYYQGNFAEGERQDENGVLCWTDGRQYIGSFVHNQRTGQGTQRWPENDPDGRDYYTGNFENGERSDINGVLCWTDGRRYEGGFVHNQRTGQGTLYYSSDVTDTRSDYVNGRDHYNGGFLNGNFHGNGTIYWKDGDCGEYVFLDGIRQGKSTIYYANGDWEERNFVDDVRQGASIYYWLDGDQEERIYVDDVLQGKAVYYLGGVDWTGDWIELTYVNGVREGPAVYHRSDGSTTDIEFINGEPVW